MGVKGKQDTIDIIGQKVLQGYGYVKRMLEERMPKLIVDWIQREREGKEDVQENCGWKEYKQP